MKRTSCDAESPTASPPPAPILRPSELQQAIYALHSDSSYGYNVFEVVSVLGPIDVEDLQKRLNLFIQQQPILRSGLQTRSALSLVVDSQPSVFNIEVIKPEKEDIQSTIQHEIQKPFLDLSSSPLLRATLVVRGPQDHVLMLVSHRCVCDERSLKETIVFLLSTSGASSEPVTTTYLEEVMNYARKVIPAESEELKYWKDKLGGSLHISQLPTDRGIPSTQGFMCALESATLDTPTSDGIKKLSQQVSGSSSSLGLAITLLTIFKILIHRHTGEEDITVGTRWDTRDLYVDPKTTKDTVLLGPFEENLVYRTFLSNDFTFIQALCAVEETVKMAQKYKTVPYYRILQVLFPTSQCGHTPLFRIQFFMDDSPFVYHSTDKIRVAPYPVPFILSPYDLRCSVSVDRTSQNIVLSFCYNTELFLPNRIKEFSHQFQQLSQQIVADPNLLILKYSLITPNAEKILLSPKEPLDNTFFGPIQDHFAARAREDPDRVAIFYQGKTVTYGLLFSLSNKLANLLLSKGVSVGDVVGIYGHRSPAVVVAIMGILSSGAAYCMMDTAYPTERVIRCMDIAKPKAWVQIPTPPPDLQNYLSGLSLCVQVSLLQPWENSDNLGNNDKYPTLVKGVNADSMAVIAFTSGSTGVPKGVFGRHGPLTHYYPWMKEEFGIKKDDRFSACSGIAHDPLQRDIFTPLFFGSHIYIPTQEDISSHGSLSKWFFQHDINVSCFTPAIGQLLTTGVSDDLKLPSLRLAFFVGDCLLKKDVQSLYSLAPNVSVINMYGSTETQRSVGYYKVPRDLSSLKEVIIVGKGMRGCQLILLNKDNKLVGIGEVAEIFIRSHHLSQGYIGLPTETEKRFLKNPFTDIEGDILYRTGDLGRFNLLGDVECVGRADDQIKIRGFRIELGEISAALGKHPTVKENITIVRQDKPGEKQLVSYVVPWPGMKCDAHHIKSFLKTKLPHYMIPTFIVQLPSFPLTPNGKIDRRSLPLPLIKDEIVIENLSDTQKKLIRIWETQLGHSVPSLDCNFFDLGGHSLLVVRVVTEIKKQFHNTEISIEDIFNGPTINQLSDFIDYGARSKPTDVDFVLETRLPSDIRVRSDLFSPSLNIKNIFLTGATGFLGAFLVSELLAYSPDIHIYCLVRAKDAETAFQRLRSNLVNHTLWRDGFANRLTAVPGDLSREFLGIIDRQEWTSLTSDIDAIIHNGAMVHWLHGYHLLKPINVGGTLEVLRLASTTKLKPVNYVSTTNVYDGEENKKLSMVLEELVSMESKGLKGGYTQSKWVAEQLVVKAISRGIPSKIFRPSFITGDSKEGISNSDDFLCRLMKGCIELGVAPHLPGRTLDMSPVDYVARAIVHIALNGNEKKRQFNVVQDDLYSYDAWFERVKSYGYKLDIVDYKTWREKLLATDSDHALKPFISYFTEDWPETLRGPKYDTTNTRTALSHTEIKNHKMDDVMDIYFSYFIECGFLSAPPSINNNNKVNWVPKRKGLVQQHRNKNLN